MEQTPAAVTQAVLELALKAPELSPRELAVSFVDQQRYFVSEASVYRLLKAHFVRIMGKRTELLGHRENPPHQPSNRPSPALSGAGRRKNIPVHARVSRILSGESLTCQTRWRRGADLNRRDPSFRTCFRAFTGISFLRRETLAGKTRAPKVVDLKVGRTAGVVSKDWL
jgi:hypothetical protein